MNPAGSLHRVHVDILRVATGAMHLQAGPQAPSAPPECARAEHRSKSTLPDRALSALSCIVNVAMFLPMLRRTARQRALTLDPRVRGPRPKNPVPRARACRDEVPALRGDRVPFAIVPRYLLRSFY